MVVSVVKREKKNKRKLTYKDLLDKPSTYIEEGDKFITQEYVNNYVTRCSKERKGNCFILPGEPVWVEKFFPNIAKCYAHVKSIRERIYSKEDIEKSKKKIKNVKDVSKNLRNAMSVFTQYLRFFNRWWYKF